jgi:DNA-binding IclR family transcriptional regulator
VLAALRLLEACGEVDAGDLSRVIAKSRATALYLLNSLVAEGFAERDPSGRPGRYRLSPSRAAAAPPATPAAARTLHEDRLVEALDDCTCGPGSAAILRSSTTTGSS